MKIGTALASKGERGTGLLKVGELSLHSDIFIPIIIVRGKEEGPTLWVNGAVHGDEINGSLAIHEVALELDPAHLRGTLVCSPIANTMAYQWRQTFNPLDHLDLDRQFPGDSEGVFSQRVAHCLFEEVKMKANYLINFHTHATPYSAIPYTVFKFVPGAPIQVNQETENVAKIFGVSAMCRVDIGTAKGEQPSGSLVGGLDVNCMLNGIPAFMAEMGGGGRVERENIGVAKKGIKNLMKYLQMIPGERETANQQNIFRSRKFLYSNRAGLAIMDVKPGDILDRGDKIAHIMDFFSELETLKAEERSYVLGVRVNPVVHTGERVALLGLNWE
jgi:predicted deacylase